jgi:cbb3-type cytochrome oxidase subunit 3
MQELTSAQINLIIGSSIFAVVFFIAVSVGIIFFFRRAERGDRAEAEKFNEDSETPPPQTTSPQGEDSAPR